MPVFFAHKKVWFVGFISLTLLVGFGYFVSPQNTDAAAGSRINFQSKIVVKTTGLNVTTGTPACVLSGADTCDFRFNIYSDPAAGTLLWREPYSNVEIGATSGYFNMELNSVCNSWTAPSGSCSGSGITWGSDNTVYLEVEIDIDGDGDFATGGADVLETFARKLFTSVPYAYYADTAATLNGFSDTGFAKLVPGAAQTLTSAATSVIHINENSASTPNIVELEVAGTDVFVLNNNGRLILPTTGSNGGVTIGGDINLYRSATNEATISGSLVPSTDNTYDLGSSTNRWQELHLGPASLKIYSTVGTSGAGANHTLASFGFSGGTYQFNTTNVGSATGGAISFSSSLPAGNGTTSAYTFATTATFGASDEVFQVVNNGTNLLTVLGNGRTQISGGVEIGTTGANNILATSAAGGSAGASLYWGNNLVCLDSGTGCPTANIDVQMTNRSGGTLTAGALVVRDESNNNSFTTTTTANNTRVLGILQTASCTNLSTCVIRVEGKGTLTVTNSTSRGNFIYTGTVAGQGKSQVDSTSSGLIGVALTEDLSGPFTIDILIIRNYGTISNGVFDDVTVGATNDPIDLTVYGDVVLGGNTQVFTSLANPRVLYTYDTLKDTDGGAWRTTPTTQGKSWYTEATDANYGACNLSSHDKCGQSGFPSTAVLIASTTALYIMDGSKDQMWMKFNIGSQESIEGSIPTSITAKDGKVYVGTKGTGNTGLFVIDFVRDVVTRYNENDRAESNQTIGNRNGTISFNVNTTSQYQLSSSKINDIDVFIKNGVTYIAAATTAGVNLIDPTYENKRTSNLLTGGGLCDATDSGNAGAGFTARQAFDLSTANTSFFRSSGNNTATLTCAMSQTRSTGLNPTVTSFSVQAHTTFTTRAPRTFTLEGSNNGSSWGTISNAITTTWAASEEIQTFPVVSPSSFGWYRLNVTDVVNAANDLVEIKRIRLYTDPEFQEQAVRIYAPNQGAPIIQTSTNQSTAQSLTDRDTSGGLGYSWLSAVNDTTPWFIKKMNVAKIVTRYAITGYDSVTGSTSALKNWIFQGSNDGYTWTALDTQTNQTFAAFNDRKDYGFSNSTAYLFYRLNVTANNGHASMATVVELEIPAVIITASTNSTTQGCGHADTVISRSISGCDWTSTAGVAQTLEYDFGVTTGVDSYAIVGPTTTANAPDDWTFQAWNGSIWTTYHTVTNFGATYQAIAAGKRYDFTVAVGCGNCTKFRLNITGNAGGTAISLRSFQIVEERLDDYSTNATYNQSRLMADDGNLWQSPVTISTTTEPYWIQKDFTEDPDSNKEVIGFEIRGSNANTDVADWQLSVGYPGIQIGQADPVNYGMGVIDYAVDEPMGNLNYKINTSGGGYYTWRLELRATQLAGNVAAMDQWAIITTNPIVNVRFHGDGNIIFTDEASGEVAIYNQVYRDTLSVYFEPDASINQAALPGLNFLPVIDKTDLEVYGDTVYLASGNGVDSFVLENNIPRRKNFVSNQRVVGRYDFFHDFEGGTLTNTPTFDLIEDLSGNKMYPKQVNGTPVYVAGKVGSFAMDFDNASSESICYANNKWKDVSGSFSMGAWINVDNADASARTIISEFSAAGWIFYLAATTNNLVFHNGNVLDSGVAISQNVWTHVAVTGSVGAGANYTYKFYIDGVLKASTTGTRPGAGLNLCVGGYGGTNFPMDGSIDDVFYTADVALTDTQLKDIMNRANPWFTSGLTAQGSFTTTTLVNSTTADYIPNEFVGYTVEILSGTNAGQIRKIVSNTNFALTVSPAFTATVTGTTVFRINKLMLPESDIARSISIVDNRMYIGFNDGSDGGGAAEFDYTGLPMYSFKNLDFYSGGASKTDLYANSWSATYDDILNMTAMNDKVYIISDTHYWVEGESRTLKDRLDEVSNSGLQAVDASGELTQNFVVRTGWSYVQGSGGASMVPTGTFGIRFDVPPTVVANLAGFKTTATGIPVSLADCTFSTAAESGVSGVTQEGFNLTFVLGDIATVARTFSGAAYYCYSWIAVGPYSAASSSGADLAENYLTFDKTIEAGDVVAIDNTRDISVIKTNAAQDQRALGIVATQPSIVLGPDNGTTPGVQTTITGQEVASGEAKTVRIGLAGRVPVKVTLEGGPIKRGDFLTPASKPGYAMKATKPGITIGRALTEFDGTSTISTIIQTVEVGEQTVQTASDQGYYKNDQNLLSPQNGEGLVMAFIQNGYYWGDQSVNNNQGGPVTTIPTVINDPVTLDEALAEAVENAQNNPDNEGTIGSQGLGSLLLREVDSSISSVGRALKFQTVSTAPIDLFNGAFIFTSDGRLQAKEIVAEKIILGSSLGTVTIDPSQGLEVEVGYPGMNLGDLIFVNTIKSEDYIAAVEEIDYTNKKFILKLIPIDVDSPAVDPVIVSYLVLGRTEQSTGASN